MLLVKIWLMSELIFNMMHQSHVMYNIHKLHFWGLIFNICYMSCEFTRTKKVIDQYQKTLGDIDLWRDHYEVNQAFTFFIWQFLS